MSDALKKLQRDLDIAEQMVHGMEDYLRMDTLFGKMPTSMPALTLGGYLMRQNRLLELHEALPEVDQQRLATLIERFNLLVAERIVQTEDKAHKELGARMRQWEETIRDLRRDLRGNADYYGTAVEARTMIAALLDFLSEPPFELRESFDERLEMLDSGLKAIWQSGGLVWPEEWEPAYSKEDYWYLYGEPRIVR